MTSEHKPRDERCASGITLIGRAVVFAQAPAQHPGPIPGRGVALPVPALPITRPVTGRRWSPEMVRRTSRPRLAFTAAASSAVLADSG